MATSPDSEPLIPGYFHPPTASSLQSSIPDHSPPSPSPLVSTGSVSPSIYQPRPDFLHPNSNITITQVPSGPTSTVSYAHRPINLKCRHCHIQVTTEVQFIMIAMDKYRPSRWDFRATAMKLWLMLVWCVFGICLLSICLLSYCCSSRYRHICPNCKRVLGQGRRTSNS